MENMIKKLEKRYVKIAKTVISGTLSEQEYDLAIEALQEIELEIIKLKLAANG